MIIVVTGSRKGISERTIHRGLDRWLDERRKYLASLLLSGRVSQAAQAAEESNIEWRIGDALGVDYTAAVMLSYRGFFPVIYCASAARAVEWMRKGYRVVPCATWDEVGPKAGPIRNSIMLRDKVRADLCIHFWDGASPGAKDCMDKAVMYGIELIDGCKLAEEAA